MTGVLPGNTLWKQAFATALAPARKNSAAALCSHAGPKSVLAFTRSFRWLISAFHNKGRKRVGRRRESAYSRRARGIVNSHSTVIPRLRSE